MLVGIAKLAAESELLESKRQVEYFELPARSILNRTKPGMPFDWAINPYRGCEFGCRYCYARYTHEFMGMEDGRDFEEKIYAKANVEALLRRDLHKVRPEESIAIGTATDPYQPAERRFGRTRAILEVFAGGKGAAPFHHHKIRPDRERSSAAGGDRARERASREHDDHDARRGPGAAARAARAAAGSAAGRRSSVWLGPGSASG